MIRMKPKIAIIDYGMGNLYSVENAFRVLGVSTDFVTAPGSLLKYDKLVLPGVGAFGDAVRGLEKKKLVAPIKEFVSSGRPFLGICLGMQLLFEESEESKGVRGLVLIPGRVKRFSRKLKCPHIGWNEIEKKSFAPEIFRGFPRRVFAYFCHSYFVVPEQKSAVIAETRYGIRFASMVKSGNVYGMQFHPEKSQGDGLKLLKNFINLH